MAPILSLLRTMAERGIQRKATFFYGARARRDLCFEAELHELEEKLPNFRYVPALSEADVDDHWDGETGFVTDVVKRHATDLTGAHAYVCGPPPMVEAALPLLEQLGVEREADLLRQVHHHRGTRPAVRSNGRACKSTGKAAGGNPRLNSHDEGETS